MTAHWLPHGRSQFRIDEWCFDKCRLEAGKAFSQPELQRTSVMRTSTARHALDEIKGGCVRGEIVGKLVAQEFVLHLGDFDSPARSYNVIMVTLLPG